MQSLLLSVAFLPVPIDVAGLHLRAREHRISMGWESNPDAVRMKATESTCIELLYPHRHRSSIGSHRIRDRHSDKQAWMVPTNK
jgi:hypothetical protein